MENLRTGIKETVQVGEVNISANAVDAQILDRENRAKVEFSAYCLARLQMKSRLRNVLVKRHEKMPGISIHFKTKPALSFSVGKLEVASGAVGDPDRGYDRLMRHVF